MANPSPTNDEGSITATQALSLVSDYFPLEWRRTKPSEIQLRRISDGFVNRIYVLSRTTISTSQHEPTSILIRQFGSSGPMQAPPRSGGSGCLSAEEQAVIAYEMARRGWGPKLYGLFFGGRLEEYIDSHTLTPADAMEPAIRDDIARAYATLHALDLPLRKNNFNDLIEELRETAANIPSGAGDMLGHERNSEAESLTVLRTMQWQQEMDWVAALFQKHDCKRSLAVGDTNFLNVLVKNYKSDRRVMLIDYETVTYSFRGIDIGGHFNERMYDWRHPDDCLTGYPAPDLAEQRSFCEAYYQELLNLGVEVDENDSVDHLLLEAKIGGLWQILFSVIMCFSDSETQIPPVVMTGLTHMLTQYQDLKVEFG